MQTVTAKLSDETNVRLENLAKVSDRKKSYLVRKAVEMFLEEKEDYFIALGRLEQQNKRYSLEYLEQHDEFED